MGQDGLEYKIECIVLLEAELVPVGCTPVPNDYDQMKVLLMKRYDLMVYRKLRASKPETDESPNKFIV